ncbi:MAG: hypothetical protein P4K78_12345 [Terracidiphilus sp.]|nr:hypothetical protein [Terracidiphilus sp.]
MIPLGNKSLARLAGVAAVLVACAMAAKPALGDASYQSSSQITGGALKDQMTSNPFTAKLMGKAFAATTTTTMVHGNQKAVVLTESTEIWDLDAQTLTHIDTAKKTYWTVTFAQMRQAMANAMKQIGQATPQPQAPTQQPQSNLQTTFQVSVNNTGVTKPVNGVSAQEQVVTLTVTMTDPSQPQSPGTNPMVYVVTTDTWVAAEDPPELKEIHDFDVRMGQLMMQGVDVPAMMAEANQAKATTSQLFANQPGAAVALQQMGQEMAKLKGTRVMTVTSVGGNAPAGNTTANAPSSDQNNSGSVLSSVLPGKLGSMMGGFHKKPAAQQPAPAATTPDSGSSGGSNGTSNVVLMQTTEQMLNFSQDAISASAFQVPAGYKQVPSPYIPASQ